MSKIAHYLQEHLLGEVITSPSVRKYYSTDASIFNLEPQIVIYPRNTSDVRKVARFTWQLAERGKVLPITARGKGTDQSGGAIGSGLVLVFPAHMKKLLELDTGKNTVRVQPGLIYGTLQNVLHTHGQFLPPYPASVDYSTIGGAVGNNAGGEKSVKYGMTKDYVTELDVVLANGELIHTMRLSKRELNKKKGLTNFEGEIYRQLDGLITDNWELIEKSKLNVDKNSAGYNLADVKRRDGSFDLTPLIVGSQGTLGIVTQITFATEDYNPNTTLLSAHFSDLDKLNDAVQQILPLKPSVLEMVDRNLLEFINVTNPAQLKNLIEPPFPAAVLLVEFDDISERKQKTKTKKAKKILEKLALEFSIARDEHEREMLWKVRHSAGSILWHSNDRKKGVPIIDDGVVPREKLKEFMDSVEELFDKYALDVAVWGHAGDGNLHMQPFVDLSSIGDRQKIFKLMDEYYEMLISLGGSTTGEHNDGRLRGPYLKRLYGEEVYELFEKVKQIFDPYNTLNPGVKLNVKKEDLAKMLRKDYTLEHLSDHLPRT